MSGINLRSSLTGFMQFVADDKKNTKALVNTFFHGYRTGWAFLICVFELSSHCMYIYIKFACVHYVLLMNINNVIFCIFGLTLTAKGREGLVPSFGASCQMLVSWIVRSFRSQFWYLQVLRSAKSQAPHGGQKNPQQYELGTDWLWSVFALWEPRPVECPGSNGSLGSPCKRPSCRSSKGVVLLY